MATVNSLPSKDDALGIAYVGQALLDPGTYTPTGADAADVQSNIAGGNVLTPMTNEILRLIADGSVVSSGRATGLAAATSTLTSDYTVGAEDESLEVSVNIRVKTATNHDFVARFTYTDEEGTVRNHICQFNTSTGIVVSNVTNGTGTVAYAGLPMRIRAKAGTTINFNTFGTFTTVLYNVEMSIRKTR